MVHLHSRAFEDRIEGIEWLRGSLYDSIEATMEKGEGFVGLSVCEVHRGEPADDFGAGGNDEQTVVNELRGEPDGGRFAGGFDRFERIEFGFIQFKTDHHAKGADVGDERVFPSGDFTRDAPAEVGGAFREMVAFDDAKGGETGSAGERAAAVGGAVGAGAEQVDKISNLRFRISHFRIAHPKGPQGEAGADGFGPTDGGR